ncbi:hypothetical protein [Spirosoma validum]|uniref:Uncharacterized protein n=1 Tax=Spirosoma validum TaxID=2771355 RepID=A0A927GD09_9BACT|nr:hypothetical protein [Spirosoma validum]MBD2753188.1 hypothetical protein [Spirosoma validum]
MKSSNNNIREIYIYLYFEKGVIDNVVFDKLIDNINTNLSKLSSFGASEPFKYQFPINRNKLFLLYSENFDFFLSGDQNSLIHVSFIPDQNITIWTIKISLKEAKNTDKLLTFITQTIDIIPIIYGFICSKEEFDFKHKLVTRLKSGGTATKYVGITKWDFLDFFPGLYSLNIWSNYAFDLDKIKSKIENTVKIIPYKNQLIAEVNNVFSNDITINNSIQNEISKLIGEKDFFFKSDNQDLFDHAKKFKDYLSKMKSD